MLHMEHAKPMPSHDEICARHALAYRDTILRLNEAFNIQTTRERVQST